LYDLPSQLDPSGQSRARDGPLDALTWLGVLAALVSLGVLGSLGALASLGSLCALAALVAEAAEAPPDACAIDIVVNAGTA